jgi:hypothetical protein
MAQWRADQGLPSHNQAAGLNPGNVPGLDIPVNPVSAGASALGGLLPHNAWIRALEGIGGAALVGLALIHLSKVLGHPVGDIVKGAAKKAALGAVAL